MRTKLAILQEQKIHLIGLMDSLTALKDMTSQALAQTINALESVKLDMANEVIQIDKQMRHDEYHIMLEEETE